ncbi:RHS repeat-associated core domain-containing protein [Streptomyces sp. NPDC058257]|uniref:RHS repeat-associated core domain-containing protein n=1 Tax=Streptomyces sp. NPDC058257 TaxID=3346409 RepID=UPI0036E3F60A
MSQDLALPVLDRKTQVSRGSRVSGTHKLPTKVTYSDGTPSQSYAYDAAGRIHEATDATGKRSLTYDDDDKIQTITSPGAVKPFTYAWNTNDTLKSRTYPDGRATSYGYDSVGRITSQTTDSKATGYGYDKAGNLTSVTLPTTTARTETRTYDEAGRLATLTTPSGSNTYGYDPNSRLSTDTPKGAKPTRYGFDDVGRMTRACTDTTTESCLSGKTGGTYTYDKVGNLKTSQTSSTTTNYNYDEADQLKSTTAGTATTSYGYDADGNQTKDGADTYAYDPLGRVKSATIGADAYTFGYDADGNRTTANKNNALIRTSRWDINNALPQIATDTNGSGALLGDYHFDPDGTARSMDRTGGSFYFTQDRQNSVSTVFDAKGTDNYRYTYSAWGAPTGKATISGGQSSIYGYTGQYKDQYLTDRLLLRDRSYDPDQRRFTIQDPMPAALDNPNKSPYTYADNDPANLSDPSGNCPMCIGAGIGGVLGGGIYALTHRDDFDWGDFAGATAKGAVIGAGAGYLAPAGAGVASSLGLSGGRALATAAVTDAAIGAGYTYAVNTVQCQPTSPTDLLFGAAGGAFGSLVSPALRWSKSLPGIRGAGSDVAYQGDEAGNVWTSDISHVTGKTAKSRNRAIDTMIRRDFPDLKLTHKPQYSPWVNTGIAKDGLGTHIGYKRFSSSIDLRNSIVHEELRHRWFARGIPAGTHHPRDRSGLYEQFYATVNRCLSMRGWQ